MSDFATIDEHNTVRLVRDLPGPIERVWAFLTDPKLLARWLSDGIVADRIGGEVRFAMGAEGRVTAYEPPHVLEYTWNEPKLARGPIFDTVVRWELAAAGNRVRLTLTHKRLSRAEAIKHGAGWHAFTDRLSASADGREPPDIVERFAQLQDEYGKRYLVKVIFGNHSSVIVPQQDRESVRRFYCQVLGGKLTKADPERDFIRLEGDFYIVFLYGDVPDESEFSRTARAIWLELKSDDVEEMRRKIIESGLVRKLEVPDPHLYFQAPGGQCFRLVGIDEDLSFYEGVGEGPNVVKVKEAIKNF